MSRILAAKKGSVLAFFMESFVEMETPYHIPGDTSLSD